MPLVCRGAPLFCFGCTTDLWPNLGESSVERVDASGLPSNFDLIGGLIESAPSDHLVIESDLFMSAFAQTNSPLGGCPGHIPVL